MASRLSFADLPFMQSTQQGNPSGIVPSSYAFGSISNMLYTAAASGTAGNSISISQQLASYQLPALPTKPTFSGTVYNVATEAEFNAALSAVNSSISGGQTINVTSSITFTAMKTISKSVEIKGQGKASTRIRFDATSAVLQISAGTNNVYVHDIEVYNGQAGAAADFSACINAPTMTTAYQTGSTGLWFENCLFTHSKRGVTLSGNSWVIKNCDFQPSQAVWGSTVRAISGYGSTGTSYVTGCTFKATVTAGESSGTARLICIAMGTSGSATNGTYVQGYVGNLVISGNTLVKDVATPRYVRAYFDSQEMFRQPGMFENIGSNGQFSMFLDGNDFSEDYQSSPILFINSAWAAAGAQAAIQPLSFFDKLYVKGNQFGGRVGASAASPKGALFFTGSTTSKILGTPATAFYAADNVIEAASLPVTYANATTTNLLGVIEKSIFNTPSPLITPVVPVGSISASVSGTSVTINVPAGTSATTLASTINANGTFAALVSATASDGNNASTSGSVTLSGGAG